MIDSRHLTEIIKARAISLGFSIVGITNTAPLQEYTRYEKWIDRQQHADMKYLASPYHLNARKDPRLLAPDSQSVIVVGLAYPLHTSDKLIPMPVGLISSYASGEDYHSRIPRLLKELTDSFPSIFEKIPNFHVYTDSAPILERELACRAGLGWIGKNSNLISPIAGSSLLLAEIIIDQPLEYDTPYSYDRCGTCDRCITACPTGCIQSDRTIDSRRCISYHTIENRGEIPADIMRKTGNWVFGCDICQMVCPWNAKLETTDRQVDRELILSSRQMNDLLLLTEDDFKKRFGKSSLARTKREGLLRNILVRLGNLADSDSAPAVRRLINTESDLVLLHTAQWALKQISK